MTGELVLEDDERTAPSTPRAPAPPEPSLVEYGRVRKPLDDRLPWFENDEAVIAARKRWADLSSEYDKTARELNELAARLGLTPGAHEPGKAEAAAIELLASGHSPAEITRFGVLVVHKRRLAEAAKKVSGDVGAAIQKAARTHQPKVYELLKPGRRKLALAWLGLVAAHREQFKLVNFAQSAGYDAGGFGVLAANAYPAHWRLDDFLNRIVADGTITAEEANPLRGN